MRLAKNNSGRGKQARGIALSLVGTILLLSCAASVALLVVHSRAEENVKRAADWTVVQPMERAVDGGQGQGAETGGAASRGAAAAGAATAPQEITLSSGEECIANEVLVTFDGALTKDELCAQLAEEGLEVLDLETVSTSLDDNQVLVAVTYAGEEDPGSVSQRLSALDVVADAEPDLVFDLAPDGLEGPDGPEAQDLTGLENQDLTGLEAPDGTQDEDLDPDTVTTDDPAISLQWGLDAVGARDAWEYSTCQGDVIIAVIDTGVTTDHVDLVDNLLLEYGVDTHDDLMGPEAVEDINGHGTHVTGILAAVANNGEGVAGVSYNAKVLPMKACYVNSKNEVKFRTADIIKAIDLIIAYKDGSSTRGYLPDIRVMNLSMGSSTSTSIAFEDAIARALNAGILPVAAVGNEASTFNRYAPASFEGVLGVSALKQTSQGSVIDSYSNYGFFVDLAAPGTAILSTTWNGGYGTKKGTSMAAPFVSGAAALLFAQDMNLTPGEVSALLTAMAEDAGDEGYDYYYGYGILRIDWALEELATWAHFQRLAGNDRYSTAQAITLKAYPEGCSTAIICTGKDFPDALSASSLAGLLDCPILITSPDSLSASTRQTIQALGATDFVIVGGTGAVSVAVEDQLRSFGGTVERLAGATRYGTAEAVCSWKDVASYGGWSDTVIIATGGNYPDALSISGYAFAGKAPILLSSSEGLSQESSDIIAQGGFNQVVIVGGTGVVPETVENHLVTLGIDPRSITRLSGANRYDTSLAIARYLQGLGFHGDASAIATGGNYPDALTGSVLVGRQGSFILLASPGNSTAFEVLQDQSAEVGQLFLLGGTGVVTNAMVLEAREALEPEIR